VDRQLEEDYRLPVRRGFVVQFGAETVVGQGRFVGRVEHIVSGQATRFQTLNDLLAFFVQVLATPPPQDPEMH
jgi:hypothetical protein